MLHFLIILSKVLEYSDSDPVKFFGPGTTLTSARIEMKKKRDAKQ